MLTRLDILSVISLQELRLAGLWSGASGVNATGASGEEREAGLRPSLLSPSLLNHFSPQTTLP